MSIDDKNYPSKKNSFIDEIKQIINVGRQNAYTAVNTAMISTYWNIGRRIVEEEQHGKERAEYGKELIKMLAIELTHEYGNGFSASSIWLFPTMRFGNRDFQICYGRIYISRFAWEMRLQSGGIWKLPLMRCGV